MPVVDTSTVSVRTGELGEVPVTMTRRGTGRPVLLLHGGGGPFTVSSYADQLADERPAQVIVPVHPGFGGTPRPDGLTTIAQLAVLYAELLVELDLDDVAVVGNSIGGWIAAELSLLGSPRVAHVALVDAVGIEVPGHPVADFFSLSFPELARLSYHDPARFQIDPSQLSAAALELMAVNRATLATYAGSAMTDPTLAGRLGAASISTLVVVGEDDRIVDPDYGQAYSNAIPGSRFHVLRDSGHLPQLETPAALTAVLWPFLTDGPATDRAER